MKYTALMDIIFGNRPLIAALAGALIAQFLKPFMLLPLEKKFHARLIISTGGMPSSHTSMVVALSTCIGFLEGVHTVAFAISVSFALITIHDAMGIRRAAGKQAQVINDWSRILAQIHADGQFTPENLKTMLGHSFIQIVGGLFVGLVVGMYFAIIY